MKAGLQFDENGNYVGDYLEGKPLPDNHTVIPTHLAEGKFTYLPKLVNGEVVEGLSLEEIEAVQNMPMELSELDKLKKDYLDLVFQLTEGGVL